MAAPDPLIQRAQQGDEKAFSEIFVRHRGDVTRLVYRVIGPTADVEDVVQDVFVHVYRSIVKFRGDAKFSTWLYRLTMNVARMHLRRGRSRPRFADVEVPERPRDAAPPETPDVIHERGLRVRALYALLDQLSEKKRTVLILHDLEGMAAKDIAEVVDAPVLTVRTRLFYARKELYAAIAQDPQLRPAVEPILASLPGKPKVKRQTPDTPEAQERKSAPPRRERRPSQSELGR
jgi:RNA polymerase sigma-70 factor (ECF subfamily)